MMETDGACLHSADPANCAQAPLPIPPINSASPLIAQQPIQPPAVTPDISDQNFLSFDTFELPKNASFNNLEALAATAEEPLPQGRVQQIAT